MNNTGKVNYLTNALTIASTAAAAGKPITMTECWVNKMANDELGVLSYDQVRARDVFSFWEPLAAYFLQTTENLANYTQMTFMTPSNSDYYITGPIKPIALPSPTNRPPRSLRKKPRWSHRPYSKPTIPAWR